MVIESFSKLALAGGRLKVREMRKRRQHKPELINVLNIHIHIELASASKNLIFSL
jgi:hypothetical protein